MAASCRRHADEALSAVLPQIHLVASGWREESTGRSSPAPVAKACRAQRAPVGAAGVPAALPSAPAAHLAVAGRRVEAARLSAARVRGRRSAGG